MKAHLELLVPESQNYVIRLFDEPLGEVDPDTGQPWKPYVCMLLLHVVDGVGELKGLVSLPRGGALKAVRDALRPYGFKEVFWERWDNGEKRRVTLPL